MFKRILLLACAVIAASATAAPRSGFDGKWHWAGNAGWQRIEFDISISGRNVTGTMTMGPGVTKFTTSAEDWEYFFEPAAFPIQNGRLDGDTITFEQSVVRNAGATPNEILIYTGKLEGDRINFTRKSTQRTRDAFILGDHKMEFTAVRNGSTAPAFTEKVSGEIAVHPGAAMRMSVFADVVDRLGNRLTNLPQSAFTILEDGNPQDIKSFASAEAPANVLMLYDHNQTWFDDSAKVNSSGFGGREWNALLQASSRFVNRLRANDRIAMAEFESSVHLALDWRNAHSSSGEKTVQLGLSQPPSGQKDLYAAIAWTMQKFEGVQGRKIAVLFTDGRDGRLSPRWLRNMRKGGSLSSAITQSINSPNQEILDPLFGLTDKSETADFEKLVDGVSRSGVQFYFVSINTDRDPEFGPAVVDRRISGLFPGSNEAIDNYLAQVHRRLERLAGVSGGCVFYGDTPDQGVSIYKSLDKSIGLGAYSFEFTPTGKGASGDHQLEIRVNDSKDQGLRVAQSINRFR